MGDAATLKIIEMNDKDISERTRSCVQAVVDEGKFQFEEKERFGEYMQVLQRANQAIFADQKKLLQRIKDAKKAAVATQLPANAKAGYPEGKAEVASAPEAAGA